MGVVAIYLLSQPDSPAPGALPPAAAEAPAPPPSAPAAAAPDLSRFQGGKAPPAPMVYAPAPVPPPDSWEALPIARERSLGPLGGALRAGLDPLSPQLSACLRAAPPALPGSTTVSEAAGDEDVSDGGGMPAVVLHIETLEGRLRIVDAPVLSWSGTSDVAMGCVQQALRGKSFAAPAAHAGRKLRVAYAIPQ
ncbi:MAG: hypothetical protein HZB56_21105 [Deltaproteobacteria bacterium]|nr:hypothetical protein [Deltaproteobacteria bacterium]